MLSNKRITIATFISNTEQVSESFLHFYEVAKKEYDVQAIMFVVTFQIKVPVSIIQIITPKTTKYRRILSLCKYAPDTYVLCIDNDIKVKEIELLYFVKMCLGGHGDLYFGKIAAKRIDGIVPNLVRIDKILSHGIIRPFLWNCGLGLSIPGQVFIFKSTSFISALPAIDTVFDDLTMGICARQNGLSVLRNGIVLGEEIPKTNFVNLAKQRCRWAQGYVECLLNYRHTRQILPLIIIHGIAYHFIWMFVWAILLFAFNIKIIFGLSLLLITTWFISGKNIRDVFWGILYVCIFPIFHIIWIVAAVRNCFQHLSLRHILT